MKSVPLAEKTRIEVHRCRVPNGTVQKVIESVIECLTQTFGRCAMIHPPTATTLSVEVSRSTSHRRLSARTQRCPSHRTGYTSFNTLISFIKPLKRRSKKDRFLLQRIRSISPSKRPAKVLKLVKALNSGLQKSRNRRGR
jgi:hypothetical protein